MKPIAVTTWNLLGQVQSFKLTASTKNQRSFFNKATATGCVRISGSGSGVMTFHETGSWTSIDRQTIDFRNIYRWSLSDSRDSIRLTHLRYGINNPVHLVDFVSLDADIMQSIQPHHCGSDRYSASLSVAGDRILLSWTIRGPAKNDTLDCIYLTDKTVR